MLSTLAFALPLLFSVSVHHQVSRKHTSVQPYLRQSSQIAIPFSIYDVNLHESDVRHEFIRRSPVPAAKDEKTIDDEEEDEDQEDDQDSKNSKDDKDDKKSKEDEDKDEKEDEDKANKGDEKAKSDSTSKPAEPTKASNGSKPTGTASGSAKTSTTDHCGWSDPIGDTFTKPLWLVIGLSAAGIFGMLITAFTAFQYGKSKTPGGGAAGGAAMGGGAPPPAY